MKQSQSQDGQYDIVIIECCENCETHQQFARHSEWKYFQQFNQLKRKIQKFVFNTIVIKNPVPDELIKTPEIKNEKNLFVNQNTNEKIIFPRIGSFEIYMYNILISSKLMTTQWPNHYKILQTVAKMIEEKKKGNNLDHFSVFNQGPPEAYLSIEHSNKESVPINPSPDKRNVRIVSKKKKGVNTTLAGKAYKSIDRGNDVPKQLKATMDFVGQKISDKDYYSPVRNKKIHRYLQSKVDTRVKLPSLSNTMANFKEDNAQSEQKIQVPTEKKVKKIEENIEQLQKQDFSIISHKNSDINQSRKFSFLELKSNDMKNVSVSNHEQSEDLKFMQNQSVQYSQPQGKDLMNRSIQYEEQEGFYCDFGMQIEQQQLQRQKDFDYQWVQTDRVELVNEDKPYTLDQEVQANIVLKIPCENNETQTVIRQYVDENLCTDVVLTVNREIQFPEEIARSLNAHEVVDASFQHLHEKRRNIIDNEYYYSIDKFQQKSTKYKWIGRANLADSQQDLKKKIFLQCLVFSVYNYYGIKTPQKRLSYQNCSNVIGQKLKEGLLHIMTFNNPELQYLSFFQDFNYQTKKFPISELITFKSSKQTIKFNNYGGFLAIAYFLNDYEIYNEQNNHLGFVIVNEGVKEIHKLSALNYQIHPQAKSNDEDIIVNQSDNMTIRINRLSQSVQLDFFSMLSRICDQGTFEELVKYIRQIFIHNATTYQQFKLTLLSLHLEQSEEQTVEDFIRVLENRIKRLRESFKGKLYTYKKYHSLNPTIKYSIPFGHKVERKFNFKEKMVSLHDIVKHLRNNNTMVIIQGEEGSGKTTLLTEMVIQLKGIQRINVMVFSWMKKEFIKIKDQLFQLSKNILLIDNAEEYDAEVIELIQSLKTAKYEVSYCILTSNRNQVDVFKNRYSNLNIVETQLLPLGADQIREYMMKVVKHKSFTDKKDIVQLLVTNPNYVKILQIPFYLSLFSSYLSTVDSSTYKPTDKQLTKYMILKQHFSVCTTTHNEEMKEMGFSIKDALPNLRRIAFQYYHNKLQVNQTIKDIVSIYQQNQLIRSQLAYYPIQLQSVVSASYQNLFNHQIFLKYFLIEAYSYFVQKSYRNMRMSKLYADKFLMDLITQRYQTQDSHKKLLQVVMSTKRFKSISQASSNAITLLNKMNYVFSNMNFDDCIFPLADLSNSVFYQCSFRGADLEEAILYKSQMISCIFDSAIMNKINLFSRKYQIQFTALTCSMSVDGRKIAFGCGNYLIIINGETGAEVKRIEAHLDIIRMVKYSRDGNSLVTIADDKTLRIWDTYTYKSVVFKLPQKGSISYSNQTETIASVNKNSLKVWNLKSMANEAELDGHTQTITLVQFSYDGQFILTGSKDSTLRLWDLKGKQIVVYKGHEDEVITAKLSPAKRTMVSSSKGKDLIMWQVESGSKLLIKKFSSEVTQICMDNKQKYVLVTFVNDNHIVILQFLSFQIVHALSGHQAKIMSLNFDYNFQQLISLGKDRTVRVWQFQKIMQNEIRSPKIFKKIHKGPVIAIAYDNSKSKYVTAHENGQINIWNAEDNALVDQLFSHKGIVRCLAVDKVGKIYSGGSDGTLRIWNLEAKREPKIIEIHSSEMLQMKLSEKNRFIATSSMANQLVINDFTGIKIVMSTREEGRVNAIQFSLDQKIMAVGGAEKYVALYDITNANTVNRSVELGQHSESISAMCFYGDTMLVVAQKNGQVAIWNYHKASLMKKIENVSPIKSLIQFQRKYICLVSEDGKIRIVNMDEGKEVKVFKYSDAPTAIDTNADDSLLLTGTQGGNVIKWNLNCVKPPSKKIEFDRTAIDGDCSRIVSVEGGRKLLLKDLFYHREEIMQAKVDSDIEGVTFDEDKIILLLKNGQYWQFGKREYRFNTSKQYEGDLHSIRDKNVTNFYRSGIKKIKGMNKPSLAIIEEVNNQ